jgi:uncharacterized protein YjbJ (UPF0337 family)
MTIRFGAGCSFALATQTASSCHRRVPDRGRTIDPLVKEDDMNDNRIKGEVKQVKGSIKEAIGKITGDKTTQAEGAAEKAAGKAQAAVGMASDGIKDALKR